MKKLIAVTVAVLLLTSAFVAVNAADDVQAAPKAPAKAALPQEIKDSLAELNSLAAENRSIMQKVKGMLPFAPLREGRKELKEFINGELPKLKAERQDWNNELKALKERVKATKVSLRQAIEAKDSEKAASLKKELESISAQLKAKMAELTQKRDEQRTKVAPYKKDREEMKALKEKLLPFKDECRTIHDALRLQREEMKGFREELKALLAAKEYGAAASLIDKMKNLSKAEAVNLNKLLDIKNKALSAN